MFSYLLRRYSFLFYRGKVVFDESFKDVRPKTGYMWFYDFGYLTEIENISTCTVENPHIINSIYFRSIIKENDFNGKD